MFLFCLYNKLSIKEWTENLTELYQIRGSLCKTEPHNVELFVLSDFTRYCWPYIRYQDKSKKKLSLLLSSKVLLQDPYSKDCRPFFLAFSVFICLSRASHLLKFRENISLQFLFINVNNLMNNRSVFVFNPAWQITPLLNERLF